MFTFTLSMNALVDAEDSCPHRDEHGQEANTRLVDLVCKWNESVLRLLLLYSVLLLDFF